MQEVTSLHPSTRYRKITFIHTQDIRIMLINFSDYYPHKSKQWIF